MLGLILLAASAAALAQTITEFPIPTPEADSWDLCAGPDGALWFNEPAALKIGRIDMQGMITEFPTPNGEYGVAAGPDGNIWFAGGPQVGTMTTAGQVTVFLTLEDGATASPIIAGSDGNMWVGLLEGRIARVTPSGIVTYYSLGFPIPIPGIGGPYSLALGSDGNVWYSLLPLAVVGKITPDGAVTNYPTPGVASLAIGAGSDGALWFVGSGGTGGIVARITTQGELQTIGQSSASAVGVGAAPDGSVWFAEDGTEKIGRVTPEGVVTELDLPGPPSGFPRGAFDVLSGPDGNLWYVRRGENRIGRVEIPGRRQPVELLRETARPRTVPPRP